MFAQLLALLPFLASANAFFIMQQKILQTTRLDPIVDPGAISGHVHTIAGGSGFGQTVSYESMRNSRCTTALVTEDKSNYWIPQLYHYEPTDQSYTMVPVDYMNAYYLPRPGNKDKKVYAFPDGLRMLSGQPDRREFDGTDPSDKAITYVCLEYSGAHRGNPDWDQRNSFFPHNECPQGIRAQVNFPNCWDGVNLDSDDHRSHMAWPSGGVDGGDCPASHPVHLVSLFYEFIFKVQGFKYNNGSNPTWAWANGDTTGYGLHADFINGWPSLVNGTNILQRAIDECNINNGVGGNLQDCPPFAPFLDSNAAYACQPENPIVNENIGNNGKIFSLPGNNPLYTGPGMVTGNSTVGPDPDLVNTTSPIPAGWTRTGCVAEPANNLRGLLAATYNSDNMTKASCVQFCNDKGLPLAGVEYGRECRCDTVLRNGASNTTLVSDSKCNMPCPGNGYENCGGASVFDLFVNPALFPAGPALPTGWAASGCRTEPSGGRALSGYSFSSSNMTNELCATTCANRGFSIAGTEYGQECWCGNAFNAASAVAPATQCNMVCKGSSTQTCGGSSRLSIITGPSASKSSSSSSAPSASTSSSASTSITSSSTSSSTASASATSSTAAVALPSGWTANGCMVESNPRVLSGYSFTSSSMTTELCLNTCQSKGFLYAGTQYASECYCSTSLSATAAPETACNMKCKGDATQLCGGSSRISTYKSNIQAGPAPAPAGWTAIGCLTDSGNPRTLDGYRFTSDSMNYTMCTSTCQGRGYNYAGVQYGRECYCSNTVNAASSVAATEQCSVACPGDLYSKCGGSYRLTAFKANGDNSATSATVATSASTTSTSSSTSYTATSTSATSTTPAAAATGPAPSGWTNMGCWTDSNSPRSLNGYKWSSNNAVTWESCTALCGQRGFTYAGMENSGECFCDNELKGSAADASGCNAKCSGDASQMCGGSWRLSVFRAVSAAPASSSSSSTSSASSSTTSSSSTVATSTTSTSTSSAAPTSSYVPPKGYKGCYVDQGYPRTLNGTQVFTSPAMTNEMCIQQCGKQGFAFSGTQYNRECYCGASLNLASQIAESRCSAPCFGESRAMCGGGFTLSVFETGNGTAITYGQAPANPPTRRALVRGGVRLSI